MQPDAKKTTEPPDARRELLKKRLMGVIKPGSKPQAAVTKRKTPGPAPLSYGQQQIWLHSKVAGDTLIYNEPITIHRRGPLDRPALERAFVEVIRRHEAWRTTFEWRDDGPVQIVQPPPARIEFPFTDLRSLPEAKREAEALRIATAESKLPFDLERGPMYRPRLFRFSDNEHRLYMTLCHIIFDGVSLYRVFLPELIAFYEAFTRNETLTLPELPVQYSDYAAWHREHVKSAMQREMAYWRTVLKDLPLLKMKTDHPRPRAVDYRGEMETLLIPLEITEPLKAISQENGVTLFMTIVAAFMVLLYRDTGQDDIVVGSVNDLRTHTELQGLIGFFLNTLVIRSRVAPEMPFTEMIARVKKSMLGALSHSTVPFELLVREFVKQRDASRTPLFQVMISVEPPLAPLKEGWDFTQMDVDPGTSKFDITLELDERPEGLIGRFIYSTALFEPKTMHALKTRWLDLLAKIAAAPGKRISEL